MHWLIVLCLGYLALCLLVMWREPGMLYYPDRTPFQTPPGVVDLNLPGPVHGWWIAGPTPARRTILFLHGNAGNLSHREEKIAIFRQFGADVCIIDYRGYGRSPGIPNERNTYADARAAYDYLTKTANREPRTIFIYGESLGSAIATELATQVAVGGLILESPFTSVADVGRQMFPYLPVQLLVRNKYDTLAKIGRVPAPLLILHSQDDEMFPLRHAERLLAAARDPKQLVVLRGGHNDSFAVSAEDYTGALRSFLGKL